MWQPDRQATKYQSLCDNLQLKTGLTLEANVLQERNIVWKWVLEPMLAVRQQVKVLNADPNLVRAGGWKRRCWKVKGRHQFRLEYFGEIMKVLCDYELAYVSGGNALDTTSGSFVPDSSSGSAGSNSGSNGFTAESSSGGGNCVTAECAAGVLPARSDNRSYEAANTSACQTGVTLIAAPILGLTNLALGLGLIGAAGSQVVQAGLRSACN